MNYKPTTQQILNWSKDILDYLKSDAYKTAVSSQDIETVNSPYRVGEQTFFDSIQILTAICQTFQQDSELLDRIDHNQRQNIYNHLQNIHQWLTSNPIGNWNSIITYINSVVTYSTQSGLNPFGVRVDSELKKKLSKITIKDDEISSLRELHSQLTVIRDSAESLKEAKRVVDFVKDTGRIEEVKKYVTDAEDEIDNLRNKARELLAASSDAAMVRHFSDVSERLRKDIYGHKDVDAWYKMSTPGWAEYFVVCIFIFVVNILLVMFFAPKLEYNNEYLGVLTNGSVRMVLLMPSLILLSFVLKNFSKKDKKYESYEFKGVAAKTLEGHLIMLQSRGVDPGVMSRTAEHILVEMYTEPSDDFNGRIDESIEKNLSLLERFKVIFKNN